MPSSFDAPTTGDPYTEWATPSATALLNLSNVVIETLPGYELVGVHYFQLSPSGVIIEKKQTGRWRVQWLTPTAAAALQAHVGGLTGTRTVYTYNADGTVNSATNQILPAYSVSNQRNPNGTYDVVIEAALRDWALPPEPEE